MCLWFGSPYPLGEGYARGQLLYAGGDLRGGLGTFAQFLIEFFDLGFFLACDP